MANPRLVLLSVAERDLKIRESEGNNRGPGIAKFWAATSYADGYKNREPYCAAAVCWWVAEAGRCGVRWLAPLPREAAVRNFLSWARRRASAGDVMFAAVPLPGDIVCFLPHFSHIGVVAKAGAGEVETIEANTTAGAASLAKERDGGGVYRRTRKLGLCGSFVRLLTASEGAGE